MPGLGEVRAPVPGVRMEIVARIRSNLSKHWPLWLGFTAAVAAVATLLAIAFAIALYRERTYRVAGSGPTAAASTSAPAKGGRSVSFRLTDPINRKSFERDVLGRSTREITDLLGSPDDTLWGQTHMAWVYRSSSGANIILVIEGGHIVKVDW